MEVGPRNNWYSATDLRRVAIGVGFIQLQPAFLEGMLDFPSTENWVWFYHVMAHQITEHWMIVACCTPMIFGRAIASPCSNLTLHRKNDFQLS